MFDIPFVHHEETFNVSEFHSRSKIDLPSPQSTPTPELSTVGALPLVPANNSGVSPSQGSIFASKTECIAFSHFRQHYHYPCHSLPQIVLRSDSELHLSRYVARDRGGQCGDTITELRPGARGFIRSPNYPADYPPDVKCTWWLKAKVNCHVTCNKSIDTCNVRTMPGSR